MTGTSDCQKEITAFLNSTDLKQMKENCANAGYFLSVIHLDGINDIADSSMYALLCPSVTV